MQAELENLGKQTFQKFNFEKVMEFLKVLKITSIKNFQLCSITKYYSTVV